MSNEERKKRDTILREPLTRQRYILNQRMRAAQDKENPQPFTFEDFQNLVSLIPAQDVAFKSEVLNVYEAIKTGKAPQIPKLETPEKQFLWGGALSFLKANPSVMTTWHPAVDAAAELRTTDLWKQITKTRVVLEEEMMHAQHVRETLRDKATKYNWSEPGTGFGYKRDKNIIEIDLVQTLVSGLEHARADVYREIGRGFLAITYTDRMQQILVERAPLYRKYLKAQDKSGPALKPAEYKQLIMLEQEFKLRWKMFDAAEENVSNRFVANIGLRVQQDHGVSLNNTAVTQRGVGVTPMPDPKNHTPEELRYLHLCNTVLLSFFQNNGFIENTDAAWQRAGVDPNMVRKTSTLKSRPEDAQNDNDGIAHADFKYLRELCGGPEGLENLQPKGNERLYGPNMMTTRLKAMDKARKDIIEKIMDLYAEELIQKMMQELEEQIDEKLEEAQDQQKQDGQDGQEGQEGENDGEGEGQDAEGEGTGSGKGKPQKNQNKDKNKQKKKKPEHGKQQGEQSDEIDDGDGEKSDGQKGDKQKQQKGDKSQKGDKGEDSDGADGDEEEQDGQNGGDEGDEQEQDGQNGDEQEGQGKDKGETVPVEGAGDMPGVEGDISDTPGEEMDPDADGNNADGQEGDGNDADGNDSEGDSNDAGDPGDSSDAGEEGEGDEADGDAKTMDELQKELAEAQKSEAAEGEGQDGQGQGQGQGKGQGKDGKAKPGQGKGAGKGDGRKLGDLAKQDWTNYKERVKELGPQIGPVRRQLKKIRDQQLKVTTVPSRQLEIIPEAGELLERFDRVAQMDMVRKMQTGNLDPTEDMKRFHANENKTTPVEIDIFILIDGSGSMGTARLNQSGPPTPLESALQAAAILFEAASGHDMHMNVYVGIWGDKKPNILIRPGDTAVHIGQAMEEMRKGKASGTMLSPAIEAVAEVMSKPHGNSGGLVGNTHVVIISDGDTDYSDEAATIDKINKTFESSKSVTYDVAVIKGAHNSAMEKFAKKIKAPRGHQEVTVTLETDPNKIPLAIVGMILQKVKSSGNLKAIPKSKKRREMRVAHNKMEQ